MDRHAEIPITLFPARDLRLERRLREIVDLIDAELNLVDELLHIDIIAAANIDDRKTFSSDRRNPVESVNIRNGFFDPGDDLFFDILRGRAVPGHRDRGTGDGHDRKHLAFHLVETENTAQEGDNHDKICSNRVAREPGYHAKH